MAMPQEIKRCTKYWYNDGNVVLQCEDIQFRIHQSLLGKHFPIFVDGSAFSQDPESVEGCPVVRVAGDSPEDWENILMTVYSPFTTYSSTMDYPIPVVLSTLRLGKKYESDHLRDMAITCLKTNLPSDHVNNAATLFNMNPRIAPPFLEYIFDNLNMALECGMQSIGPMACLSCINFMGLEKILNGHTRSDGSTASLSPVAFKMVISGWHSLTVAAIQSTITHPMRHPISEHCRKDFAVDTAPGDYEVYECGAEGRARENSSRTARVAKNPVNAFILGGVMLCSACAEPINSDYYSGVDELWDKLPSFFGFPSWDQLKDFYP